MKITEQKNVCVRNMSSIRCKFIYSFLFLSRYDYIAHAQMHVRALNVQNVKETHTQNYS